MDDIGVLSTSCLSCFDTLTRSLRTSSDEFKKQMRPIAIENEYARFKIWAGNLGALQRGRHSLDARLRDSVVLRAAVLKFMGELQDSLRKSAEITTGLRLPYEQGGDATHGPDEDAEDNSDTSGTSSDLESGEIAERLDEIKDIMEHLYKLSFKIRNTRYRSLTKKALLMKEEDPQTGKDLFSAYAIFDRRHVQESLNRLRLRPSSKEFATEPARNPSDGCFDVLDGGDRLLNSDDFLQDRLAKAITNRRKYFAYWRRHALKLSHVTDELAPQQNFTTLVKPARPVSGPPTTPSISGYSLPTPGAKTLVSGTDFSLYNRKLDDQLDTETVISYATTAYDVDGNSPELPPPPPDAATKPEFVCQYCWVACPSRQGKGKSWQEHIRQDLQPYVCTYEECSDADRMHASRHAWLEHERLVHRRIWRCFEHRSFSSKSKNGLLQHFLDCHKGLDEQQIENLLDIAETTVADDRQTCPFCFSIGPFAKGFHNHVAFHQEQFATFAVPRNFDSNKEADSEKSEGIRSAGSLCSVALDFSDGDSSLDSDDSDVSVNQLGNSLLNSANFGDAAAVRLLLEKGANPDLGDNNGQTPLLWAAKKGHEAVVKLLLEKGADPTLRDYSGQTPLSWAAGNGHEAVVKLLLEKGTDPSLADTFGQTPLSWAAKKGHEAVVKLLLEKGTDPSLADNDGQTPLLWATINGHKAVVKLLLEKGIDPTLADTYSQTPLSLAAETGHEAVVKRLLDNGADPESIAWAPRSSESDSELDDSDQGSVIPDRLASEDFT
ncbi:hypothetical protein DTO012A7_5591 [Penicillium roqueforti]|nr:hypothetical protein CBS147330_3230 [Penicillium roqueforti]KAI3230689.1 hypothetical protein DTO012A7_5591 [Penicillium roqueforti]